MDTYSNDDLFTAVSTTVQFSEIERDRLRSFRERGATLFENYTDFMQEIGEFQINSKKDEHGYISSTGPDLNIHRLKGLFVDYRFFVANKEPTHYASVVNFVSGRVSNSSARNYLALERRHWLQVDFLGRWHGVKADDIVASYFNGKVFHDVAEYKVKLSEISKKMDNYTIIASLFHTLLDRVMAVLRLSSYLDPAIELGDRLRLPVGYEDRQDGVITIQQNKPTN
jgi:hypothetical protein